MAKTFNFKQALFAFVLVFALLVSLLPAMSTQAATEVKKINVTSEEYGANGKDKEDDFRAIQDALNEARDFDGTLIVNIPAGTYYLSKNLNIFSDTTLKLHKKAKIVALKGEKRYGMIQGAHDNFCQGPDCTHGGYTQGKNITIQGGTWDMDDDGYGGYEILTIRHAKNIKILNVTFLHACDHFINLSGSKNVTVKNCTFKDAVMAKWKDGIKPSDMKTKEAIHLDFCEAEAEHGDKAMPHDNTPCQNVTINNCKFLNVWSGIGTHHYQKNFPKKAKKIVIKNNTAKNVKSYFVWTSCYQNLKVENNKLTGCGGLICMQNKSTGTINNNKFKLISKSKAIYDRYPVWIYKNSKATITNNTIKGSRYEYGICIEQNSKANIKKNTITGCSHGDVYYN